MENFELNNDITKSYTHKCKTKAVYITLSVESTKFESL